MQKSFLVLITLIATDASAASQATPATLSRKRLVIEELQKNMATNPVPSGVTTRTRAVVVKEAAEKEVGAPPITSSLAKRTRSVIDPQEILKADISNLVSSLSSTISTETKTRLAVYIASNIVREEKQKKELDDFTGRITAIMRQLDQIKGIMSKQPSTYRAFRLSPGNHICCGKEVVFVVDLLHEVETAVLGQQWGRVINFTDSKTTAERPSDYVNEDFIAGSWVAFLDARLRELEIARSMQNYLERASKNDVQNVLTNRIIQLRELCQLLRDAALNKRLGSEYRDVVKESFDLTSSSSEISTSSSNVKRQRT